ncbi:MAG: YlbF family regulator [Clostridiales bacterium]|jgi:cell fate (sporulation/competence/biofilm development) regulator YlbF (YheA/YmcA/DUF963 family)|nr:YlbF family regulator [Clostridiales bacterium]
MEKAAELAQMLCAAFRDSEVYQAYLKARDEVSGDEELSLKMYRFKKLNAEFRGGADQEGSATDDEKRVAALYHDLRRNDSARIYLDAEREIISALCSVAESLREACDIEMIM